MGKILVVFLCFFLVVVFGSSVQNPESNSTREISKEFLSKMRELEKFHDEFKGFKSSLFELSAAFGRFHQSLTKTGTATGKSGETGEVRTTTPSTPQQPETENPALKSIRSCSDAMEILPSPRSAKQRIYPHGNNSMSLEVLCDFEIDGGGWTVLQKRTSGPKEQFKQNWIEYKNGFGSLSGNFWIGLENIRALTQNGDQELRIQLEDFQGNRKYAKYSRFSISDASDFYRLTLGGFSGDSTLRDSFAGGHNGQKFTTIDKDNDNYWRNCAVRRGGGWWFNDYCGFSNLNGLYFEKGETVPAAQGILWESWKGWYYSLAKSEMKIRKRKP